LCGGGAGEFGERDDGGGRSASCCRVACGAGTAEAARLGNVAGLTGSESVDGPNFRAGLELDAGWAIGDDVAWPAFRDRDIRLRLLENARVLGDGEDGVRRGIRRVRYFSGRQAPDEALRYTAAPETRGLGTGNHKEKSDETRFRIGKAPHLSECARAGRQGIQASRLHYLDRHSLADYPATIASRQRGDDSARTGKPCGKRRRHAIALHLTLDQALTAGSAQLRRMARCISFVRSRQDAAAWARCARRARPDDVFCTVHRDAINGVMMGVLHHTQPYHVTKEQTDEACLEAGTRTIAFENALRCSTSRGGNGIRAGQKGLHKIRPRRKQKGEAERARSPRRPASSAGDGASRV
jgi:hypothetical protein